MGIICILTCKWGCFWQIYLERTEGETEWEVKYDLINQQKLYQIQKKATFTCLCHDSNVHGHPETGELESICQSSSLEAEQKMLFAFPFIDCSVCWKHSFNCILSPCSRSMRTASRCWWKTAIQANMKLPSLAEKPPKQQEQQQQHLRSPLLPLPLPLNQQPPPPLLQPRGSISISDQLRHNAVTGPNPAIGMLKSRHK